MSLRFLVSWLVITGFLIATLSLGNDSLFLGLVKAAAPTAPSNPALTSIPDLRLELTWQDNSSDETSFSVQHSPDDAVHFVNRGQALANVTTYIDDNDLSEARVYYYRVGSCNSFTGECSAFTSSASIRTPLIAPQYLYVTQPSVSINRLSWTDASRAESNYVIERRIDSGLWSAIATIAANSNSYDDASITQGQTYAYRVKATSSIANSDYSNAASPGPPKNLPNPTPIGAIPCLDNYSYGYTVSNNVLYSVDAEIGLSAFNVSDPGNPLPIGTQHPFVKNANAKYAKTVVNNNIAVFTPYGGQSTKRFILDISDSRYIKKLSEIDDSGDSMRDIALSGNYAYTSGNPIKVIDLNDPTNPQTVKTITVGSAESAYNVFASNNRLFYTTSRNFGIVDISDPLNPVKISYVPVDSTQYIKAFAVDGNTAVFLTTGQIKVFDVSNLSAPLLQGALSFTPPSGAKAYDIVFRNNFAYAIDNQSYLNAIDLSNPQSPAIAGRINIPSFNTSFSNPFAFIDIRHLLVNTTLVDVSNPAFMTSSSVDNCRSGTNVVTNGKVAVASDWIVDLSDIYNPKVVSQLAYYNFANPTFKGEYFYALANRKSDGMTRYLVIVNLTNPDSPIVYEYAIPYIVGIGFLAVSQTENLAAVKIGVNWLYSRVDLLDISDPSQVTVIGSVQGGDGTTPNYSFFSLLVHNKTVYIADNDSTMKIFDVATPTSPQLLATYPIKKPLIARIFNGLLYVVYESDEFVSGGSITYGDGKEYLGALRILDISDRLNPRVIGQYVSRDTYPVTLTSNLDLIDDFVVIYPLAGYLSPVFTNRSGQISTVDISSPSIPIYSPYQFGGIYLSPGFTIRAHYKYLIQINSIYNQPQITKSADKTSVRSGEEITFSLTASNPTADTFTALSLADPIPIGTSYVAGSAILNGTPVTDAPDGDAYTLLNGVPTWSISSLPPSDQSGSTVTASFKVRVN